MKEFSAQTGGRYTYADDLENLQELSLAFAQIFDDCDNFIVSGCEVNSGKISAGYVFINGKLRYFSGASGITTYPQYIYERNTTETVAYESGAPKVGRNIYGCALSNTVPTQADVLSGALPQSITILETGGMRMKDAFIGKYALLLDPSSGSQRVNGKVSFVNELSSESDFTAQSKIVIKSGTLQTTLGYSDATFDVIYSGEYNTYKWSFADNGGISLYANDVLLATIGGAEIIFNKPVKAQQGIFGGLAISGNDVYQGSANEDATLYINRLSYNGETSQYRDTVIGNGKGGAVLSISALNGRVNMHGATYIAASVMDSLVLRANVLKDNNSLTNAIAWKDSDNKDMARIGFASTTDQSFSIMASTSDLNIVSNSVVNIGPAIKEDGVLLSEKYVLQSNLNNALDQKVNRSDVYVAKECDIKFAKKDAGLSQFVTTSMSAATCRSHIGAAGTDDLNACAKLTNYLSDMAKTDADKKKICDNIGAAPIGDFQAKLNDSGWILIQEALYVRQIGNIVSIQGSATTAHEGTMFTLPNTISAPTHAVKYTIGFSNKCIWSCHIAAGQRACTVVYCDEGCHKLTDFSITYMV